MMAFNFDISRCILTDNNSLFGWNDEFYTVYTVYTALVLLLYYSFENKHFLSLYLLYLSIQLVVMNHEFAHEQ